MIIQLLITIVIGMFSVIFGWFPEITTLPYGIDELMVTAVQYFHGAMETLPYLEVVWNSFLIVLGFELAMLILKFILGHRVPSNEIN